MTEAGHETSDVSIGGIVKFGIGLAAVTIVIYVAVWGFFRLLEKRERRQDQVEAVSPMVSASLRLTPPLRMRAREDAVLTTYGWVDRNAGVARIPIARAIDLLVERGLPVTKPVTPAVTPVPGGGTRDAGQEKNP